MNKPERIKATFNIDADLHRRLKILAAEDRRMMVDIVECAIRDFLSHRDAIRRELFRTSSDVGYYSRP